MAQAAAKTGIMPTALVAVEQTFPPDQRVLNDRLAYQMLPPVAKLFVRLLRWQRLRDGLINLSEKSQRGIWGGMLCRKRYIDEQLTVAASRISAIVNLGAGFDTRLYRIPIITGIPAWEVDQAVNIEAKKERLCKALGTIPAQVHLVAVDFDKEDTATVLAANGYPMGTPTFFICAAVTQYLTPAGLQQLFGFLSGAAPGSRLVFSYVRADFFEGKEMCGWEAGYKRFVVTGIWLSAMEPEGMPSFLSGYGWRIIEHVGYDELADRYLRPTHRGLTSTQ